jgi:hypothetical protein
MLDTPLWEEFHRLADVVFCALTCRSLRANELASARWERGHDRP